MTSADIITIGERLEMIIIDGNIGSGKSSVLTRLQHIQPTQNWNIIPEKFVFGDANNDPILPKFYNNPDKYGMSVQLKVLLSHMENKTNTITDSTTITERSPLSCLYVFGELLAESGYINEEEQAICIDINKRYGWFPNHAIYIRTSPDVCYERIHNRGRDYERESIKLSYLESLHDKYENLYTTSVPHIASNMKVYVVDGNRPIDEVYANVLDILAEIQYLYL